MADPTVASTVRAMRRTGAAGEPVPAEVAAAWAKALMEQLYGSQKPVRYECRRRGSREPWEEAEPEDVANPAAPESDHPRALPAPAGRKAAAPLAARKQR